MILSWFLLAPLELPRVAGDAAAAALSVGNIHFAAGATDYFSLDRVGLTPMNWREVVVGGSVWEDTFAAGVAYCEIRRVDQPGVQVSTLDSHSMQVVISRGLTALSWTAPGSRGTIPGCTNPFWVAVNVFLRGLGLFGADASKQLAAFVLDSVTTSTNSGTADIASMGVAPLVRSR